MPSANRVPDDLQHLLPLTPAVFFILFALADGEKHGYAIMQSVSRMSDNHFRMGPGTLYTTIQRLLDLDLISETSFSCSRMFSRCDASAASLGCGP